MVNIAIADYLRTKRPPRPRIVELWAVGPAREYLPYTICDYPVTPDKVTWISRMGYTHACVEVQGRRIDFGINELNRWR